VRRRLLALLALSLAFPATAVGAAAVRTIGSPLTEPANYFTACNADPDPPEACTVMQTAMPGAVQAAPNDGVITRWRVRSIGLGIVTLRVLRPNPDGTFTAIGSSLPQQLTQRTPPGGDSSYSFPTRIPVLTGDRIGVDRNRRAGGIYRNRSDAVFQTGLFVPPLADFDSGSPDPGLSGVELMVNADVEPDEDGDGYGDKTQDNCPAIPNDQTSNPCPSTGTTTQPGNTGPGAGGGGDTTPPPSWRRHRRRTRSPRFRHPGALADPFGGHRRRSSY
jgi:hypothetical protein